MWIFTRDGFFSIVRDRSRSDHLLVRARAREDISKTWPSAEVVENPRADYPCRASIPNEQVAHAIARAVSGITYPTGFKGGVIERDRHDAYFQVWNVMRRWQERRRG